MPPRNKHFHTHEPFQNDNRLILQRAEGPFGFLNPTRAHFDHSALVGSTKQPSDDTATSHESVDENGTHDKSFAESNVPAKNARFLWRSRDNRKGRHALLVQRAQAGEDAPYLTPRQTSHTKEVLKIVIMTFTYFPIWDISWLVAFVFTLGSVVWVINVCSTTTVTIITGNRRNKKLTRYRDFSPGYQSRRHQPSLKVKFTMEAASPHSLARSSSSRLGPSC